MNLEIRSDYAQICREVAQKIARLVRQKPDAVLGLATGSTPLGVYAELIRLHREEGLDFSGVRVFNLDEYFPMSPEAPQSYARFMRENLFSHLNILPENCLVPSGLARVAEEIAADCLSYEARIGGCGGLDFQLVGIGRNGHIGFNEPGSAQNSRTRLVTLDSVTRGDAASDFFGLDNVPIRAITTGIGTILDAREVVLMASGAKKAGVVREAVEGKVTSKVPASFLREHPNSSFWLDSEAASELEQVRAPWRADDADFTDFGLCRQALIAVALASGKTLSQISHLDLEANGVSAMAPTGAQLEQIKAETLADLRARLDADKLPTGKTVLCLSPHPDDDVICCGATLARMAQNNRVFVAYGVNGANAVRDKDVLSPLRARHPRLVSFLEEHLEPGTSLEAAISGIRTSIFEREPGTPDAPLLRQLKRLVREGEAADACRKMGAKPLFLDLPFYGDGVHRAPVGEADVGKMRALLGSVRPDLVMLTGEHNDPHGTHEMCEHLFDLATQSGEWAFEKWKYRGAWDDYDASEGDFFFVFDKAQMDKKIDLILDHISQLDPLFPGAQPLEFWERAQSQPRKCPSVAAIGPVATFPKFRASFCRGFSNRELKTNWPRLRQENANCGRHSQGKRTPNDGLEWMQKSSSFVSS